MFTTHLFSNSPNFIPKSTLLHKTLKDGKRCLRALGRATLGSECATSGKFERITGKENKGFPCFVSGFLATITKPFEQAPGGEESRQGLP